MGVITAMLLFLSCHSSLDQLTVLLSIQEPIPTPFIALTLSQIKEEREGVEGTVMGYPGVTSVGLGSPERRG